MADTLQDMAATLGVDGLAPDEQVLLLNVTRDVAHRTERRYAPLSAFLLGLAVAGGDMGLHDAVNRLRAVLPAAADPPAS